MLVISKKKKKGKFYIEIRSQYWAILHPNIITIKVKTKEIFPKFWSLGESFTLLNPIFSSIYSKFGDIL